MGVGEGAGGSDLRDPCKEGPQGGARASQAEGERGKIAHPVGGGRLIVVVGGVRVVEA